MNLYEILYKGLLVKTIVQVQQWTTNSLEILQSRVILILVHKGKIVSFVFQMTHPKLNSL